MNIIRKVFHGFICISRKDRVNIVKTLIVNFAFLPFVDALKFPVIIYGPCKLGSLRGKIVFGRPITKGMLKIGVSDPVRSVFSKSYLNISGTIKIENRVVLRRGIHLQLNKLAVISLGDNVFISDNCTIISTSDISIDRGVVIGNNSVIMDTDFHYTIDINNGNIKNARSPIHIGEDNWIGGWCTIKKGSITPIGTIVAGPYSMVSKDYRDIIPNYSIIAGCPAKLVAKDVRMVNNTDSELELRRYFKDNNAAFYKLKTDIDEFCKR